MTFLARHKIPLLLFLLSVLLFANTMDAERLYSWDDNRYLEENELVRKFQVGKIFTEAYFGGFMPITLFSFSLEHLLWGLDPTGYHAVNLLLHSLNGVLVFFLLYLFTRRRAPALIGAVLFIVHPVQVETVAWISERKNLLSMFFFLWAFISHIRGRHNNSMGWQYASWGFYLLAVLSKPIVVGAPILFMAYDYFWARRSLGRTMVSAIPLLACALFGAVTILITSAKVGGIKEYWGGSHWSALQLTFLTVWDYLVGLIDPSTLSIHYIYNAEAIQGNWRVWAGFFLLLSFAGLGFYSLSKFFRNKAHQPIVFFLFLWVAMFMLPVSNIVPLSIQRADRFIYFPSIAIFMAVGLVWEWVWQRRQGEDKQYVLVGGIVALSVFFMIGTYRHNQVWKNCGALWTYQLQHYPDDEIAVNNLGFYYFRTQQYPMAMQVYTDSAQLAPQNFRPFLFLGLIAFEQARYYDAIRHLRQALPLADANLGESIKQKLLEAYDKAVKQAQREGQIVDAVDYYHEAVEIAPDNRVIYNLLGNAYRDLGNAEAATTAYQQAMAVSQDYYAAAHANLGLLRFHQGALDEAQSIFEEGLSKEPNALAASGQCKVLAAQGKSKQALEACYMAIAFAPNAEEFYEQLVATLLRFYSPEEALSHAAKQLSDTPDLMSMVIGSLYAHTKQYKEAIENFQHSTLIPAQLQLGEIALLTQDFMLAEAAFNRVLENNPDLLEAIGGRCLALSRLRDSNNAISLCQTAAERNPSNSPYVMAYADVLLANGRLHETIPLYRKVLDSGGPEVSRKLASVYFQLGLSADSTGLTSDAIHLFRQAIALNPDEKLFHGGLGNIFLRQKRYAEALVSFDAAIKLDPENALAYANKGIAAHALGKKDMARTTFERALAIDSQLPLALNGYCAFLLDTGANAEAVCRKAHPHQP